MNYIFIFLAAQDPKLNTVIQNISARTEISGNGSKRYIKTVRAHALLLEFSCEIEVLQFDADCSDRYVTLELS